MNRKQRRAASKQPAPARPHLSTTDQVAQLFAGALRYEQQRQWPEAARAYRRLLELKPEHAEAHNNLGRVLQAQGKRREASAAFATALRLMPQLFDQYAGICATLVALQPALGEARRRAADAWPQRLDIQSLFDGDSFKTVAGDPLLHCLLEATPVRDLALERLLTMLRAALLTQATHGAAEDGDTITFACVLARQCFINEYIYITTPDEDAQVAKLKAQSAPDLSAFQLAVLAMYEPLGALDGAQALLARTWPAPVEAVLTQQVREPAAVRALRSAIPKLTAIEDPTSQRVRAQYEENPYPRWVYPAGQVEPLALDDYLRGLFPTTPFAPVGKTDGLDILVAGCGTGWHAISTAQKFRGAQVLAIDLSLSSLCYAKRMTPAPLADRIEYAQADILKLGTIERRFDVIDASGVLHHMADWRAGWRTLLPLLRPDGLMQVGLYSESGRGDVVAARRHIAERGYGQTPGDIRRCRQDLLDTPLRSLTRAFDFFATSECRDLLFHVQETRVTIPEIKQFLTDHGLRFLGFEFDSATQHRLRATFAQSGWSLTDLDRWHALEESEPGLFAGMYQFWVQKR